MFFAAVSRNLHHADVLLICSFVCGVFKKATATCIYTYFIMLCSL